MKTFMTLPTDSLRSLSERLLNTRHLPFASKLEGNFYYRFQGQEKRVRTIRHQMTAHYS